MRCMIVIPARMASSRLPGKPLADIHGIPMIVHVWQRAMQANVGEVVVACAEREIVDAVMAAGGKAMLTDPDHASGSDRIWEVMQAQDERPDIVINLQGDLPLIDPAVIGQAAALLRETDAQIATLAAPIQDEAEWQNPNVVKIALSQKGAEPHGRALYFSRAPIPHGGGQAWHHIGIYAYRTGALEAFVALPPSPLEQRERLEQLRALEAGMHIEVGIVNAVPMGVDTPEDLHVARDAYLHAIKQDA